MNSMIVLVHLFNGSTVEIESELASGVDVTIPNMQKFILDEIKDSGIDLNDVRLIQTQYNSFV